MVGFLLVLRVSPRDLLVLSALTLVVAWGVCLTRATLPAETRKKWAIYVAIGAGLLSLGLASAHGWPLFGLVLGLLIMIALAVTTRGQLATPQAMPWWAKLGVVGSVVLASIAWQIRSPVPIDTVRLSPPPRVAMKGLFVPFFGGTDAFLYVADVRAVSEAEPGIDYRYSRLFWRFPATRLIEWCLAAMGNCFPR
jgi:hypothetical protein